MPEPGTLSFCAAVLLAINGAHASLAPNNWVKVSCLQNWIPADSEAAQRRIRLSGLLALIVGTTFITLYH